MDFDHDDHADVVIATPASSSLEVFRGLGDGTFRARNVIATGGAPTAIIASPFNVSDLGIYIATARHVAIVRANRDRFN